MSIRLLVNGREHRLEIDPATPLLEALRDDLELNGARFGCGLSQCGACAVLVDGTAVNSCVTPVSAVEGRSITTLQGLGTSQQPHPLQTAFIEEQAMQCGYCSNGMIMRSAQLLQETPEPSEAQVREALQNHLCRCGAHPRILRAVLRAAKMDTSDA